MVTNAEREAFATAAVATNPAKPAPSPGVRAAGGGKGSGDAAQAFVIRQHDSGGVSFHTRSGQSFRRVPVRKSSRFRLLRCVRRLCRHAVFFDFGEKGAKRDRASNEIGICADVEQKRRRPTPGGEASDAGRDEMYGRTIDPAERANVKNENGSTRTERYRLGMY